MSKYSKGIEFEEEATSRIAQELSSSYIFDYYLIRDVAYKGISRYEQVDCMLICSYGIYCFELKSWNGEVKPTNGDTWAIYNNGKETGRRFPNPLKQNARHCAYLKFLLDKYYPDFKARNIPVFSIVLFSDETGILQNSKSNVMHIDGVVPYIMKHNLELPEYVCSNVFKIVKQVREQCLPEYQKLHLHQIKTLEGR